MTLIYERPLNEAAAWGPAVARPGKVWLSQDGVRDGVPGGGAAPPGVLPERPQPRPQRAERPALPARRTARLPATWAIDKRLYDDFLLSFFTVALVGAWAAWAWDFGMFLALQRCAAPPARMAARASGRTRVPARPATRATAARLVSLWSGESPIPAPK